MVFAFLFPSGVLLGHVSLERGLGSLLEIAGEALTPVIGAARYLIFATQFILVFGLAFEFPAFLFAAAAADAVTSKLLRSNHCATG